MNPVVKILEDDHALVIRSASSAVILCTLCGGRKAVISYTDVNKHLVYSAERTCRCLYAPNPGGDMAKLMSPLEWEQQQLLSHLYTRIIIEDMRLSIPLTPARAKYSNDFQELLERLYHCRDMSEARSVMERYSIGRGAR